MYTIYTQHQGEHLKEMCSFYKKLQSELDSVSIHSFVFIKQRFLSYIIPV